MSSLIPESAPKLLEIALVLVSVLFWTKSGREVSQINDNELRLKFN